MKVDLLHKAFNTIIDDNGIETDRYEREDAFFGILDDIKNGFDPADVFMEAFDLVFGTHLTREYVKSRIALCEGFKGV